MNIRKIIILFSVLSYIEFYGLIDAENFFRFEGVFKIYDFFIFLVILYLVQKLLKNREIFINTIQSPTTSIIKWILVLIFIVVLSMVFRSNQNILSPFKIARYYFPLFIFFIATYETVESGTLEFIKKLILFSGSFLSIIFILGMFLPSTINNIFPNIGMIEQERDNIIFQRYYTPGFLLPIAALFLTMDLFNKCNKSSHSVKNMFLLFINFLGAILQGFRAYIILTFIVIVIILIFYSKNEVKNYFKIFSFFFVLIIFLEIIIFPGFLRNRIETGLSDYYYEEGTYRDRFINDINRLILFEEHKLFGIGFIDANSPTGKQMGLEVEGDFSAYTTDTGYLTLLISFGLIGSIIFYFLIILIIIRQISIIREIPFQYNIYSISSLAFLIMLLITLITHGGLFSPYGLIPLSLLLSLSESSLKIYKINKNESLNCN